MKAPTLLYRRAVPVRYEADVAVIGGGIAGVSTACAAARSGARVILVERMAVAGGDLTVSGVNAFCGETRGQGEVFDHIVADLTAFGAIARYHPYAALSKHEFRLIDHEILAVVLQELLLRRRVKLLLHTRFVDACVRKRYVTECIVCGKSGPEAVRARVFVDATGEADLAHAAGFESAKGRPGDGLSLPMSLMFFVREVARGKFRRQVPHGRFERFSRKEDLPMVSVWPAGPGRKAIKAKVAGFDATDTESLTAAEIRGRQRMMAVLDYFQRVEKRPWLFDHASPVIGIREGRRIVGEYVLTEADVRQGRAFDDAIARGVFYLDAHDPATDKRVDQIARPGDRLVPPYHIPFRSLIVRGAANLLAAGRCLSADHIAQSSARVATTCSMMGQAAGIAAAMAATKRCVVAGLDPTAVQKIVEKRGANLRI
jgi:hypothetical protein